MNVTILFNPYISPHWTWSDVSQTVTILITSILKRIMSVKFTFSWFEIIKSYTPIV